MEYDFDIWIPSRGRASRKLSTIAEIPPDLICRTALVVGSRREREAYLRNADVESTGVSVVVFSVAGIAATRQKICDRAYPRPALMLDDDMYFYTRPDMSSPKLRPALVSEKRKLLRRMLRTSEYPGVFACGLSARQGNNRVTEAEVRCTRMMNAYAVNTHLLRKERVRFDKPTVMEDFWVTLSMLTRGYENVVIYDSCWNQQGSNNVGGCSEYRTAEVQARAAQMLRAHFPDFVTVVTKKGWRGMKERTDVRVQWKKAYDSSVLHARQRR